MRLKECSNSWRASGIKRRDKRHAKEAPEIEKPKSATKNTKRWCLGKVGREHVMKWEPFRRLGFAIRDKYKSYVHKCQKCGKELDRWYDFSWTKPDPMPESLKEQLKREGTK